MPQLADRVRIATHLAAAESRVHVDGTRGAHGAPHAATCGSTLEWTANDFRGSAGEATGDDDGVAAPGEPPPPQPPPSPPPAATSPVSMAPSADGAPASSFDEAVSWQSSAAAAWRAEGGGGGGKLALLPGGDGGGCAYALPEDLLRAGAAARAKYSGGVCGEPTVHGVPPMPSVDAALAMAEGSVDLVFIDGSHEEADVRQDIEVWRPNVRRGGILAGHDYQPENPGVVAAVDDLFRDVTVHRPAGSLWYVEL